jgi:lysophospholipase L1-like esterase
LCTGCATNAFDGGPEWVVGDSVVLPGTEAAALAFDRIDPETVKVRSAYSATVPGVIIYEEGRDYILDAKKGMIQRTVGSRIPDFTRNVLYGQKEFDHNKFPGFGNTPFFAFVDYKTRRKVELTERTDQAKLLKQTGDALRAGGSLKIICYGDSIAAGGDATFKEFRFEERYAQSLRARFPGSKIEVENGATGGDSTVQGLARLEEKVLSRKPGLVLVGFGMNDHNRGGVEPEQFEKNLIDIVTQIREKTGAEVMLFSSFPPNPDWKFGSGRMELYAAATREAAKKLDCAYADVYSTWMKAQARKDMSSLRGNNINHPNDFGHWLYFSALDAVQF